MNRIYKSYQLHLLIKEECPIKIGRLGTFLFPQGKYIYTGSAKKNIEQRLKRHLRKNKKLHWHIDYLLAHENTEIIRIQKSIKNECESNQSIKGDILIRGFGSSDCRNDCASHLKYISR